MINTRINLNILLNKEIEEILYNINMNARKIKKAISHVLDISQVIKIKLKLLLNQYSKGICICY